MAVWFDFEGRWHALNAIAADATTARCGLTVDAALTTTEAPANDPYPPDACRSCMISVGMDFVDDEPLDVAVARGVLRDDSA